jgi:flagellin-like hook-associated protein FlgL
MANEISLTVGMRNNLLALQKTAISLQTTQDRLSSGKKVNTSLDNPTNFFAAQAHMERASDLTDRKDSMNEAVQTIKNGDNGIRAISSLIQSAKALASAAISTNDTVAQTTYFSQYMEIQTQISQLASDSIYRGTNLLNQGTLNIEFGIKTGDARLTVSGFDGTSTGLTIDNVTTAWGTQAGQATTDLGAMETALSALRTKSSSLASSLSIVTVRQDFTNNVINTLQQGADGLTLADMNQEGANMLMLQTRQSLGTTALSLSSQAAQSVLRLF